MLSKLRLKHGMHWKRSYPTPLDYKTETRLVAALALILFMLWLAFSRLDFEAALVQEQINLEDARKLQLACLNQTINQDMKIGWVVDGQIIVVNCENFGSADIPKRRMM